MERNISRILTKNKKANYTRTSSGGQDLALQISSNAEYVKEFEVGEVIEFTDFDVSATKLAMDDRPALNRMLKLIKQGVIDTVIVYERDRLARNVYEYIAIVQVFYQHHVEVIYTASDAPPFNHDLFVEAWYGLSAQFEGQRIKTRLTDARKRNPPQLLGYKKKMRKNGQEKQRYYEIDKEKEKEIYGLFKDFSEVQTYEDLFDVIMKYQRLLKRSDLRIIDMLQTPFYAAHYESSDGTYKVLQHVEPIIDLKLFEKVQEKLNHFEQDINKGIAISNKESRFVPRCGKCRQALTFKKGNIGESGSYYCKKHRKYSITVNELHQVISDSLHIAVDNISFSELEKITGKAINEQMKKYKNELYELQIQLEKLCIKASQNFNPKDDSKVMQSHFQQINSLKDSISRIDQIINQLNVLKDEIHDVVELTRIKLHSMEESECMLLAELLISGIILQEDYVQFNYYFNDFFKEEGEFDAS